MVEYLPSKTVAPMSFIVAKTINGKTSMRLLRALFDSGGSATMIHERCLPKGCQPTLLSNNATSNTIAGNFTSDKCVHMKEITLPEFDRNKKIEQQGAFVFGGDCTYDVILGRDFLTNAGIDICFADNKIQGMNLTIEMKSMDGEKVIQVGTTGEVDIPDENFTATILDAKYEGTPDEVAKHKNISRQHNVKISENWWLSIRSYFLTSCEYTLTGRYISKLIPKQLQNTPVLIRLLEHTWKYSKENWIVWSKLECCDSVELLNGQHRQWQSRKRITRSG